MPKLRQIKTRPLKDPDVSKSHLEIMRFGVIHYMYQLGFSQYDLAEMLNMKRTNVQSALNRITETGSPIKRVGTGRICGLDDHVRDLLTRMIEEDPFVDTKTLQDSLEKNGRPSSYSTVKRYLKLIGLKQKTRPVTKEPKK